MQGALVAPTEVLAQQHYKLFQSWIAQIPTLRKKPPVLEILTLGSGNDREKAEVKDSLKAGKVNIVVGTHALLQHSVGFRKLGIAGAICACGSI